MTKEGTEVYLSKDILQGEEVPFYIRWKRDDIRDITLELSEFTTVVEYHNIRDDFPLGNRIIKIEDLKSKYYLGGVLKTDVSNNPFQKGFLKVIISLLNGEEIEITQERILYSTKLEAIVLPEYIRIPFDKPPIEIQLQGSNTVFIGMESTEDSDLNLELPEEIQNAFEKFDREFMKGLKRLRKEFPEYKSFLDIFLNLNSSNIPNIPSVRQLYDKVKYEIDLKKPDKSFSEAIAMVFFNALLSHDNFKDSVLIPLIEYFESNATKKAYLMSPFLNIKVPKGGGRLKLIIYCVNILEIENILKKEENIIGNENINSLTLEMFIESEGQVQIPIKELIKIRREL